MRQIVLFLALLSGLAAFAATATVTVAGKTVTVPVLQQNGKSYVDIVALMALLQGKVTIKATPAPAPAPGGASSAGTVQLAGDNGELGKIYSLIKDSPVYFCLKSAAFTVGQVRIGDTLYTPKVNEKLLLLRFTVQNPQKTELYLRGDSLRLTAVDAMNVNQEGIGVWGDAETQNALGMSLKPAQKIEVYAVVKVPAKGPVPKLMVMPPGDNMGPILRYDLRGKVTPLPEPFADPADPAGVSALDVVPGRLNTAYPCDNLDITVERFSTTQEKLADDEPEEGGQFLVVNLLLKNKAPNDLYTRWDTLAPILTSTDGEELRYIGMLLGTTNRPMGQNLKPGQEMRVRLYFGLPAEVKPQTLQLKENDSRGYSFSVQL